MKFKQSLVGISVAGALMAMSGNAAASAFALIEQSSGLGNAFAGGAAAAEDATTIFFNPAGMSRLKGKQVSVAGSFIKPSAKFSELNLIRERHVTVRLAKSCPREDGHPMMRSEPGCILAARASIA